MSSLKPANVTAKAGTETPFRLAGNVFAIISISCPGQDVGSIQVKTNSGQYVPLRQGEGISEPFETITVNNTGANDLNISLVYGTSDYRSNTSQIQNAQTFATSDQLVLDATAGVIAGIFIPGVLVIAGQLCRRKKIEIQNVSDTGPNTPQPVQVQFLNSCLQAASFDTSNPLTNVPKMTAAGFSFSAAGGAKVTGNYGIGQLIAVDATGTGVRSIETDSVVGITTTASKGSVNKVYVSQYWYPLHA